MPTPDIKYAGDLLPEFHPTNLLIMPKTEEFYVATADALPWKTAPAPHTDKVTIEAAHLERLFQLTRVPDPTILTGLRFIERTLDVASQQDIASPE